MESFFRIVKLRAHFKDQYNEELNTEGQISNLKATKIRHLVKTITPSKHILKQHKENLNNREISVTI